MRQGTAAQWTALNPTLANTEVGLETDTGLKKTGNGSTAWTSLSYSGGSGDALVANPLSQFAATTSAQLRSVLSDETGTGAAVFATSPALTTPTGIVKGDVGLGNVDNTSNATERAATRTLTNARITRRVATTTSSATPTINTDNVDVYGLTAQGTTNITSFTTNLTGTPVDGDRLWIYVVASGALTIAHGSSFEAGAVSLVTAMSGAGRLDMGYVWNAATSKWRIMASGFA